jgi:hypothetical protein
MYKLFYIQNNTKEVIEIIINNKKDFQERIKKNGKTFIHFGTEKI